MTPEQFLIQTATRRQFFQAAGMGMGGAALASLLRQDAGATAPTNPLTARKSHLAPKAKNVIYIHLVGAPSHLDLFDFKPELQKRNGVGPLEGLVVSLGVPQRLQPTVGT